MEVDKLTPELLKEMTAGLFGEEEKPQPKFYTGASLDVEASVAAGRRIEHKVPYLMVRHNGYKDAISKKATKAQIAKYPQAFERYKEEIRNGKQAPYEGWQELGSPQPGQEHRNLEGLGAGDARTSLDGIRAIGRAIG